MTYPKQGPPQPPVASYPVTRRGIGESAVHVEDRSNEASAGHANRAQKCRPSAGFLQATFRGDKYTAVHPETEKDGPRPDILRKERML